MKSILSLLSVLVGVNAFGSVVTIMPLPVGMPARAQAPNMYSCKGAGETEFHYTTTSFTGSPTLKINFEGKEPHIDLSQIKTQQTLIGNLVTITDHSMVPVDGPTVRYSIVLPQIAISGHTPEDFQTVMVRTVVANPFFRPTPSARIVENNEFVTVDCTASLVYF